MLESFTLVEILTLFETCTKEGPLLGLNFFISHDRPPRNACWGLFYNTCDFLDKLCRFKGSRRDFLRSISGRVQISTRVKDSISLKFMYIVKVLAKKKNSSLFLYEISQIPFNSYDHFHLGQ